MDRKAANLDLEMQRDHVKAANFDASARGVFDIRDQTPADHPLKRFGGCVPEKTGKKHSQQEEGDERVLGEFLEPAPESFHCRWSAVEELTGKNRISA
jgi:hypothetical protein